MSKTIVIDAREILGTSGRYLSKLLEYLQKLDTDNQYYVLLHPEAIDKVELASTNFHKHTIYSRRFTLAEQLKLPREIKSLKPDLIHFGMTQQPAFMSGEIVTTIHDLTAIKIINTSGNKLIYSLRRVVYAWLAKRAARKSKVIITISEYSKQDIVQYTGVDPQKVVVTLESADEISDKPEPVTELTGKDFIFYVGRAHPHKNINNLVKAFAKIHESKPDLVLVLAGKRARNYESAESLVNHLGLGNSVIFTDFVSEGQLRWMYENARAYIFPSLSEGFGLPGLEAMIHGCPVVSSNATCLPEIYGDAAHYFDPANTDNIATKILEVIQQPDLRNQLVEKGKHQVGKYSWERMAQQTLDVYKKVLG